MSKLSLKNTYFIPNSSYPLEAKKFQTFSFTKEATTSGF